VKKVAKSSAVIEVVGGGEGGQRREFNVLKRLRMSKMKATIDTYSGLTNKLSK